MPVSGLNSAVIVVLSAGAVDCLRLPRCLPDISFGSSTVSGRSRLLPECACTRVVSMKSIAAFNPFVKAVTSALSLPSSCASFVLSVRKVAICLVNCLIDALLSLRGSAVAFNPFVKAATSALSLPISCASFVLSVNKVAICLLKCLIDALLSLLGSAVAFGSAFHASRKFSTCFPRSECTLVAVRKAATLCLLFENSFIFLKRSFSFSSLLRWPATTLSHIVRNFAMSVFKACTSLLKPLLSALLPSVSFLSTSSAAVICAMGAVLSAVPVKFCCKSST